MSDSDRSYEQSETFTVTGKYDVSIGGSGSVYVHASRVPLSCKTCPALTKVH